MNQWIELRSHGKLWARYNPQRHIIEFARQDVRATFDLKRIEKRQPGPTQADEVNPLVDKQADLC